MRKIKFRAKRLDNGKWIFGVPIPNSYGDRVFFIPLLLTDKIAYPFERLVDWVVEVAPETIGQYTGIEDKNGVEIHEGDLVQAEGMFSDEPFKVWFRNGMYHVGNWNMQGFMNAFDFYEVIGNIYESPEILEESK